MTVDPPAALDPGDRPPTPEVVPRLALAPRLVANLKAKAASEVAIKLVRVATIALAARWLGAAAFGAYSYALALAMILVQFADFGLHLHLAREIARSPRGAAPILARVASAKLLLSGIVAIGFVAVSLAYLLSPVDRAILWLVGAGLLLGSFVEMGNHVFRGFQRLDFEARLNLIHIGTGSALGLLAIRLGWGVPGFAAGGIVAGAIGMAIAARWIHTRFVPAQSWLRRDSAIRAVDAIRPSAPIGVAILFAVVYFRVDVLILGAHWGKEAVGQYASAHKVIEASMFLPAIFLSAAFPAFSELTRTDRGDLRRFCRTSLYWLLALGAPLAAGAALLSRQIVRLLYGSTYLPAAHALLILSPAIVLIFLNYGLTHFLIGLGKQRLSAWIAGICLVVNLAGNLLFVPRYGMSAAAATAVATEAALFALAFPLVRRGLAEEAS